LFFVCAFFGLAAGFVVGFLQGWGLVAFFFATAGFIGSLFLIPLFLQEVRGASPLESGLTTFPEAIGVVTSTQLVARLYPRVGPRRLMIAGLIGLATSIMLLGAIGLESDLWVVRGLMFLVGACMAYMFLPNQAASMATISPAQTGRASTIFNVQRQLGAAVGVAALSTVLSLAGGSGTGASAAPGYRAALFAAAGFALVGAMAASMVPAEEAAETMRPRHERAAAPDLQAVEPA
jgi:predicted MFS family arabinose efflux permease